MKNITRFSVNYPVTITMFVFAIVLLGYISLKKLPLDLFPEMDAPRIFVEMIAGERPPEEIEKQFVEDMESMIIRQKGVKEVSSVCMVGSARITVEYSWGSDMDEAFLDLQKALASFNQDEDIDEFTISQHDPNATPIIIYALENEAITDMDELRQVSENFIRNELIRLEGVADVKLSGTEEKQVVIQTNPMLLDAFGLTTDDIVQQIQSMNQSLSGGSIVEMGKKYIIKGTGLIQRTADFNNLIVGYKSATSEATTSVTTQNLEKVPVFLKDIADVKLENKEPENIVRINGKRCIGLSIYKETGYNTVNALEDLEKEMDKIQKTLNGYQFTIVQNQGEYIRSSIDEVKQSAIIGGIIAIFVLFLFLRSFGVTLVVSMAIPISVIATFNLMYFNHLSLNIMTLGGLALGAGMLVDNAIVVMENIFRNLEKGLSIKDAAVEGTAEVGGAIIASTLTTIVVFLPIVYIHGASAALFKDQAWTVAFSLLASLFVAIFIIPMFFYRVYKNKKSVKAIHQTIKIGWYGRFLERVIEKRIVVIIITIVVLGLSSLLLPRIGSEYLPKASTGEFTVELTMDEGTQLERTYAAVSNMEEVLKDLLGDRIESIFSQVGPDVTSGSTKDVLQDENTASIKIKLTRSSRANADNILVELNGFLQGTPGMKINITKDETALQTTMGADEAPLVVEVQGEDLEVLESITSEIKAMLTEMPELENLETSIESGVPEIDVVVDRFKASMLNLDAETIAEQLKDKLMGKEAGKFEKSGELQDITVKLPDVNLSELSTMKLKSDDNEIPVYEIARLERSTAPRELHRRNQNRIGRVTANIESDKAFDKVVAEVQAKINTIEMPAEYYLEITGEEQKRKEAMSSLGFALLLSIVLVYMVMASQFESFVHPFTILLTIPLAGVGTVWAFYLLDKPLNMMAYIGVIMLGGIAVNDSIILVDFINQLKAAGHSLKDAIVKAGEHRIRPIIMTSLTTILALFPMSLGFGESAEVRSSMAIAVISGLITSTLLTLVVIPCVYYVFDRKKDKG